MVTVGLKAMDVELYTGCITKRMNKFFFSLMWKWFDLFDGTAVNWIYFASW